LKTSAPTDGNQRAIINKTRLHPWARPASSAGDRNLRQFRARHRTARNEMPLRTEDKKGPQIALQPWEVAIEQLLFSVHRGAAQKPDAITGPD
jgi:hypothetical protein